VNHLNNIVASVRVFIARQHTVHTERDIVLANPSVRPSVRPSVCPVPVLCLNEWIIFKLFLTF